MLALLHAETEAEEKVKAAHRFFENQDRKFYKTLAVLPLGRGLVAAAATRLAELECDRQFESELSKMASKMEQLLATQIADGSPMVAMNTLVAKVAAFR
eukprot:15456108-Alexandrium_andersonii.AAC.1